MSDAETEGQAAAPSNPEAPLPPSPSAAMGLKAFHVVFITASIACSVGFGVWGIRGYGQSQSGIHLGLGIASLAFAVVLAVYGRWFLRKLKGFTV